MKKIIVANWKMNGSLEFMQSFIPDLKESFDKSPQRIMLCPPFPYLNALKISLKGTDVLMGAQNCHTASNGAYTGEVSATMLADIGCQAVIVGHSERRTQFGEDDETVKTKASLIHEARMIAIICVGETYQVRESGQANGHVIRQVHASLPTSAAPENTYIAYEPIWAIGTGITASIEEIREMHEVLREVALRPFPLLYGGSVTEQNAQEILKIPNVDGVLVGGASLKKESFKKIIE